LKAWRLALKLVQLKLNGHKGDPPPDLKRIGVRVRTSPVRNFSRI
jgi:hypothetical protein